MIDKFMKLLAEIHGILRDYCFLKLFIFFSSLGGMHHFRKLEPKAERNFAEFNRIHNLVYFVGLSQKRSFEKGRTSHEIHIYKYHSL